MKACSSEVSSKERLQPSISPKYSVLQLVCKDAWLNLKSISKFSKKMSFSLDPNFSQDNNCAMYRDL